METKNKTIHIFIYKEFGFYLEINPCPNYKNLEFIKEFITDTFNLYNLLNYPNQDINTSIIINDISYILQISSYFEGGWWFELNNRNEEKRIKENMKKNLKKYEDDLFWSSLILAIILTTILFFLF